MQNICWKLKAGQIGRGLLATLLAAHALTAPAFAAEFQLQPVDQYAVVGQTVTFTAAATGTPPLSYQWYWDDNPVAGATSDRLTLPNVQFDQRGDYYVAVTDASGSITSRVAELSVSHPTGGNHELIEIPREASGESNIRVSGMTGVVTKVIVTISGLRTDLPRDMHISVAGPSGQAVVLMANVGDDEGDWNVTLTFDDDAGRYLPGFGSIHSGYYKPTIYGFYSSAYHPPPYSTNLSDFNGIDPNGNWTLIAENADDNASGEISDGWRLTLVGPSGGTIDGQTTRYVNLHNPTPSPPYTYWGSAATRIQDAIDAAEAGDDIVVTNGVYATGGRAVHGIMTNRVAVTKAVMVRSVNGPAVTRIEGAPSPGAFPGWGDAAIRGVYLGSNATLNGFTLTNGWTRYFWDGDEDEDPIVAQEGTGGGVWCEPGAVVTNCILIRNRSGNGGGGAYGGQIHGCKLLNNGSEGCGGGALRAELYSCVLNGNNTDASGGGVCVSTLFNCVLRANYAESSGGGASGSTLYHCTIVANNVDNGSGAGVAGSTLYNCICYYNGYPDNHWASTFFSSCSTAIGGSGNITNEPAFVNRPAGDYRLRAGSPCIDTGTNLSALVSSDINGLPRPLDGNRDGVAGYDMGAYEFNPLFFTSIMKVGSSTRLCWFDTLAGMQLQAAASLNNPVWTNVPFAPGTNCLELPAVGNAFFRLLIP